MGEEEGRKSTIPMDGPPPAAAAPPQPFSLRTLVFSSDSMASSKDFCAQFDCPLACKRPRPLVWRQWAMAVESLVGEVVISHVPVYPEGRERERERAVNVESSPTMSFRLFSMGPLFLTATGRESRALRGWTIFVWLFHHECGPFSSTPCLLIMGNRDLRGA